MRYVLLAVLLLTAACNVANCDVSTWKVATVHGANQFAISEDGSQLLFLEQPRNAYGWYWDQNNGAQPGVLATSGLGPNGWRDGSRTFALTDVAFGRRLNEVKLEYDYCLAYGTHATMNFFITDGMGRYGIFSPASGGFSSVVTTTDLGDGWVRLTMDLTRTDIADSASVAVYEHIGFIDVYGDPFTTMTWGDIKNYYVAGVYDYQRSPANGWEAWGGAFQDVSASWSSYVIRNASGSGNPPAINEIEYAGYLAKEFVISEGGMKAAWGTKALDGKKVSDLAGHIDRLDSVSDGPYAPYFNVWITDGNGKYAVIANEPSNPEWLNYPGSNKNFDWDFLKTKTCKVYENTDVSWLPNNGPNLTFEDLADYTILAPTPAELAAGWDGLGGGAPRELGTNKAYGFNWVFGDTLSNYVASGGYIVAEPAVIKDAPVYNQWGIGLIWGDTVGNTTYANQQRLIRNVSITLDDTQYDAAFESVQSAPNHLFLQATEDSIYIKPTETAVINLNVANLQQPVSGLQAFLNFSSEYFKAGEGQVSVADGGGHWDQLIWNQWNSGGDLDVAVGVKFDLLGGTQDDATTAVITLTPTGDEGVTQMIFRADADPDPFLVGSTILTSVGGTPVWPIKSDSQNIVIDGTLPLISIISAPAGQVTQGTYNIVVTASDALAGLDGDPVVTVDGMTVTELGEGPAGTWTYQITVDENTINGLHTITASVSDKAGNANSDTAQFAVNKNQITGTVTLEGFVGGERDVEFSINGDTPFTQTLTFVGDTANYTITGVPGVVSSLSAKSAWNLRQKLEFELDSNGQAAGQNFFLLGGDLDNSNSVNVLDYAVLKKDWNTANAAGDIDGSGTVGVPDYNIMKGNWFQIGHTL